MITLVTKTRPEPRRGVRFVHPRHRVQTPGRPVAEWGHVVCEVTRTRLGRVYYRTVGEPGAAHMPLLAFMGDVRAFLRPRPPGCPEDAWDALCRAAGNHGRPTTLGELEGYPWLIEHRLIGEIGGELRVTTAGIAAVVQL